MEAGQSEILGDSTLGYVLNCSRSLNTEDDWSFADAAQAGIVDGQFSPPSEHDLREDWWDVDDQGRTGACVGFATAYGLLRWHYVKAKLLTPDQRPSARFVWMANKETDELVGFPTTFLEAAGTQTKLALKVVRNYGCVPDDVLPMTGQLSTMAAPAFYSLAAQFRIRSYHNLGRDLDAWRVWLATKGPILTRLDVEDSWYAATANNGNLDNYDANSRRGGHAVCLVGYTQDRFIVRNSWGKSWGDGGFAYASVDYTCQAFTEAYGAVL